VVIGGGSRGRDILTPGRCGRRLRGRGEPGGDRAPPLRDLGGRRSGAVIVVRRQDRQVVDEEHPAGRGAVAQPTCDHRQVAFELGEALVGRVRIPEPGDAGLDPRQRPDRPGQAGQGEAGQEADVVAARGHRDQARVRRDGRQLRGLAGGGRREDVTGGGAGIGHVVQVEPERTGDQMGVVTRRPAGPARAVRGARRDAGSRREGTAHRDVTAPRRDRRYRILPRAHRPATTSRMYFSAMPVAACP
jgi:hypothetical protein